MKICLLINMPFVQKRIQTLVAKSVMRKWTSKHLIKKAVMKDDE